METVTTVRLFGLELWNTDRVDCARRLVEGLDPNHPRAVYFINAHCVNVAATDPAYRRSLAEAYSLLPDGAGMELSARLTGIPRLENLNGTDLFPCLLAEASPRRLRIGLVGAKPGIAVACMQRMLERDPSLCFVLAEDGYQPEALLVDKIRAAAPDIVFVAMGVPLQEFFIQRHRDNLGVPLLLGVGALFDFYSESVARAPMLFRTLRLEWLHRLLLDPRRLWRRYLIGNLIFLVRMLRLRMSGREKLRSLLR